MAEREGFEPSMSVNPYALSRGAPSASRPSLPKTRRILTQLFKMPMAACNFFLIFKILYIISANSSLTEQTIPPTAVRQTSPSEFVDKFLLDEQTHP